MIELLKSFLLMTDLQIAKNIVLKPITEIAKTFGIDPEVIEMYGRYKAKIPLNLIDTAKVKKAILCWYPLFRQPLQGKVKPPFQ